MSENWTHRVPPWKVIAQLLLIVMAKQSHGGKCISSHLEIQFKPFSLDFITLI